MNGFPKITIKRLNTKWTRRFVGAIFPSRGSIQNLWKLLNAQEMPKKYINQQKILTNDQGHISVVIETDNAGIGGGTQYSVADVNADPTGTVAMGTDGTNLFALHTDTEGDLQVDVLTLPAVTGTVTAELSAIDNAVLDDIALDTEAIKDSLETVGGQVVNLGANNDVTVTGTVDLGATDNAVLDAIEVDTTVIAGAVSGTEMQVDVVAALPAGTNAIGKLLQPDIDVTTNTNYAKKYYTSAGAVTDGIIWSPAAGKRWHIHTIFIQVSAAATVTLEDDLAAGDSAIWKGELAANSGVGMTFPEKYPWASVEDAADLIITTSAGNVYVTASGIEI